MTARMQDALQDRRYEILMYVNMIAGAAMRPPRVSSLPVPTA
jgi:hypothetical protein